MCFMGASVCVCAQEHECGPTLHLAWRRRCSQLACTKNHTHTHARTHARTHTHTHTHTHTLHGQVNFLCTHKDIKAVSFVGSGTVGRIVYDLSCAHGKRVQCNMGAKNHAVIMPDAQEEQALNGIIGAAFGAAGQR